VRRGGANLTYILRKGGRELDLYTKEGRARTSEGGRERHLGGRERLAWGGANVFWGAHTSPGGANGLGRARTSLRC
jgi:hypothetical protein